MRSIKHFLLNEDGPTAVEYEVMLALIIVFCSSVVGSIGSNAYKSFWSVAEVLD